MVRSFCFVSGGLALALAVTGFFPGYEVHRCGLDKTSAIAITPVGNTPYGVAVILAIFMAVVVYIWSRPLLANAQLGAAISVGLLSLVLIITDKPKLEPGYYAIELPAAMVASQLVLALAVVQLIVVPIACWLSGRGACERDSDRIARAHVHRIGRA
jgi:hypothetical protein